MRRCVWHRGLVSSLVSSLVSVSSFPKPTFNAHVREREREVYVCIPGIEVQLATMHRGVVSWHRSLVSN